MSRSVLRLGTRKSPMALTQSGQVARLITARTGRQVELVGLTSFVPARRAGRLSAIRAISPAGGASSGRSRGIQRRLARTALPRPWPNGRD